MFRLFYTRYLQGRELHSSIITNSIFARIGNSKEKVLDILRSIPLDKPPYFCERGKIFDIYPSGEEERLQILQTLSDHGVTARNNYIDQETDGLVIRDRIIMNFVPDGYRPLESMITPKHYELFNVPDSYQDPLLFFNDGSKYVSRVHFMYKKHGIMKMSPNVIQIRHIEGLTRPFLDQIFDGIHFHKLSSPLTANGVWTIYMANQYDYLLLLSQPYFFGSKLLDIAPYYESSLRLPLEQKISRFQIYLYSRSEKLSTSEQIMEAIPELSNIHITKSKYEKGNLFIFDIHDRIKYLQVLHLNGSSLNGTTDYIMTFGDDITINNISSNILINSYKPNLHVDGVNKTDGNEIGSISYAIFKPKTFITYKQMINRGINYQGNRFYPTQIHNPSYFTFANTLVIKPRDNKISEQEIHNIFTGIPIESTYQTNDNKWLVSFTADNFEAARFRLFSDQRFFINDTCSHQFRFLQRRLRYLYINHFYYQSNEPIDLPFQHRVLYSINGKVICLTSLENYCNYCNRSIQTSKGPIYLAPYSSQISKERSFIQVLSEDAYELIENKCSYMNILYYFVEPIQRIYPRLSSLNDLDRLSYFLFNEKYIYPEEARFYPGMDLLEL